MSFARTAETTTVAATFLIWSAIGPNTSLQADGWVTVVEKVTGT